MTVTIDPTLLFLILLETIIIPIAILIGGFLFFYFKPKHRRIVSIIMIIAGILEAFYNSAIYSYLMFIGEYALAFLTVLFGVALFFSTTKYAGRKL